MNFLWGFLGLGLLLGACQSAESLNKIRVVEQSRQDRPAWVGSDSGSSFKPDGSLLDFHLIKTRVIDLPLGLRQAEAASINDTRLLLENLLHSIWQRDAEFQGLDLADRAALTAQLRKHLNQKIMAELIRDIYYEKLFDPNEVLALQETYTVHILIQLPRSELQSIQSELRNYCRSSMRQGLIKLSRNDQVFSAQP